VSLAQDQEPGRTSGEGRGGGGSEGNAKKWERAMPDEDLNDLRAELERLRNENASLKRESSAYSIRLKVSEKGAVSVYGLGRFPVTLYKEQWLKLLDRANDIRAFIATNESQLKAKD
jgi:hypothetical protein